MPLARIISRRSEDALPLVNELHAQGYEVEVFSPDEPMEGDADVELVIETAPANRAANIVQTRAGEDADLFVAPGVIAPAIDEKAVAAARAAEEAARRERLQRDREEQERIAAERRRAEQAERERITAEQRRIAEERERERLAAEAAERERQGVAAEQAERERVAAEQRRRAEEEAERERQRVLAEQRRAAEEAERQRILAEQKRIAEEQERERQRIAAEEAERERVAAEQKRIAEERERERLAAEAVERERQRLAAEEAERERQRVAAEIAARERREAEARRAAEAETRRQREEQEQLAREERERHEQEERKRIALEAEEERQRHVVEAQRRAAAAAQEEQNRSAFKRLEEAALLRAQALEEDRRAHESQPQLPAYNAALPPATTVQEHGPGSENSVVEAQHAEQPIPAQDKQSPSRRRDVTAEVLASHGPVVIPSGEAAYAAGMRYAATAEPGYAAIRITRGHRYAAATAGATVIAILLALGWAAIANRRPANPLGAGALIQQQNVDQQAPFGSTTLKPAASNEQPAASSQSRTGAQAHQASRQPSAVNRQTKPAAARPARRARASADSDVADDVIVRHYANGKPQPTKTAQQKQQAGLKKISDLQ